jgi:hypothetical protein
MAEIKIFRAQTERGLTSGQPLALKAPDLGVVGRAVSQFGEALGNIGEERAKIGAAAKATAAHTTYRNEMLGVERAARGLKPEDAEAYYKLHSKNAYDKANNSLPSSYAKSLYATQAGQTAYTSRAKFYKEHDARLISTALATGDINAAEFADKAADIALSNSDRWTAAESAFDEYTKLAENGAMTPEAALKAQMAWSGSTLERILRTRMEGARSKKGGAVGLIQKFKKGELGDELADAFAKAVGDDELIKITARMELAAHRIETHKRQAYSHAQKLAKDDNAQDTSGLYSTVDLKTARAAYNRLMLFNGFGSKSDIENAQEWLGELGDPEFADKAGATQFRTSSEGSDGDALDRLFEADRTNTLTPQKVAQEKSKLTETRYHHWMQQVGKEHSEGVETVKKIMNARFRYTRYQNSDNLEKEQTRAAYSNAIEQLHRWVTKNPQATHAEILTKGDELIDVERAKFTKMLRAEFLRNYEHRGSWRKVLGDASSGTMDAMARIDLFLAQNGDDKLGIKTALFLKKKLNFYKDFDVNMTLPGS